MAHCIEAMGSGCILVTGRFLKMFQRRPSDEDPESNSNAAFSAGLLCLDSTDAKEVLSAYASILSSLEPLLHASTAAASPEPASSTTPPAASPA